MGFVRIEIVTSKDKKFSAEIESVNLHSINCFSGSKIELPDKICEICVLDEILLVRTEDRDFRSGCQGAPFVKDNREENNVNAYDWQGNHLWNIGELVGDIKMAFDGITHITPIEVEQTLGIKAGIHSDKLFKCISGGFVFVIDAENKKMLCKVSGKAK